jgi:hypothetical protein
MQHLLLAISIIGLTIIATHERNRQNEVKVTKVIETPKTIDVGPLPEQEVDNEFRTRHVMFDMYGI